MRLALDVGLAGLPLGIERVEGEIEIMLGRFARVDRAALRPDGGFAVHGVASPPAAVAARGSAGHSGLSR